MNKGFDLEIKGVVYGVLGGVYLLLFFRNILYKQLKLNFFIFYFLFLIYLLFLGVINENFSSYLFFDLLTFSSIIFIFLIGKEDKQSYFYKTLPRLGVWINIISLSLALLYVLNYGLTTSSIKTGRGLNDLKGSLFSPKYLMYGSFFIYPLVVYVKNKTDKLIYLIGMVFFIAFSLFMGSRGTTVIGIVVMGITYYVESKIEGKKILKLGRLVLIFFGLILFAVFSESNKIFSSIEYLLLRFESGKVGVHRNEEAFSVINSLTTSELFTGRGLGASNKYWIFSDLINGVNNVHYGSVFLLLKGGFFFLFMIYIKIISSLIKLWKHDVLKPYSIILITFIITDFSHNNFNNFANLIFMFVALTATNLIKYESTSR
ncbi:hypothetical protein H3Z83_07155 [Tenacibaculum sp. S7007]|uniref:Uncharacterized protein n=1 Tax=Tenacibaculum pelagium TaxID=2759527 RepID=A0A839APZ9_9FLAO|nr:hypothetical protein [Tenacibaculum pelagium]MBA6156289.1 hypothetical protein [Tenacibaculum pelagium]